MSASLSSLSFLLSWAVHLLVYLCLVATFRDVFCCFVYEKSKSKCNYLLLLINANRKWYARKR